MIKKHMTDSLGDLNNADFIARLKYRTAEEGGRQSPAFPKYRPQVKFAFSNNETSGQQIFIDKKIVYPGESVDAFITIIDHKTFRKKLEPGQEFEFREGARIIGTGKIIEVLNDELKK